MISTIEAVFEPRKMVCVPGHFLPRNPAADGKLTLYGSIYYSFQSLPFLMAIAAWNRSPNGAASMFRSGLFNRLNVFPDYGPAIARPKRRHTGPFAASFRESL
jgi:hypothetical protein